MDKHFEKKVACFVNTLRGWITQSEGDPVGKSKAEALHTGPLLAAKNITIYLFSARYYVLIYFKITLFTWSEPCTQLKSELALCSRPIYDVPHFQGLDEFLIVRFTQLQLSPFEVCIALYTTTYNADFHFNIVHQSLLLINKCY